MCREFDMAADFIPKYYLPHHFEQLDRIIEQHHIIPRSLNPQKSLCTKFEVLGDLAVQTCPDKNIITALKNSLEQILIAQIKNFPKNIFWDFDFLVAYLVQKTSQNPQDAISYLEIFANKIIALMDLYGNHHVICFRYVHDFSYGFDWARWIKKQPQKRNQIEPFNTIFLDDLLKRGQQMSKAIANDENDTYRSCNNLYRNSFNFSREPEAEFQLMTLLASYHLIPVPTWNWNATPTWEKPFDQLREQISLKIGSRE